MYVCICVHLYVYLCVNVSSIIDFYKYAMYAMYTSLAETIVYVCGTDFNIIKKKIKDNTN